MAIVVVIFGALLGILGIAGYIYGLDLLPTERGVAGVIAASVLFCGGVLTSAVGLVLMRLEDVLKVMAAGGAPAVAPAPQALPPPIEPAVSLPEEPAPALPKVVAVEPPRPPEAAPVAVEMPRAKKSDAARPGAVAAGTAAVVAGAAVTGIAIAQSHDRPAGAEATPPSDPLLQDAWEPEAPAPSEPAIAPVAPAPVPSPAQSAAARLDALTERLRAPLSKPRKVDSADAVTPSPVPSVDAGAPPIVLPKLELKGLELKGGDNSGADIGTEGAAVSADPGPVIEAPAVPAEVPPMPTPVEAAPVPAPEPEYHVEVLEEIVLDEPPAAAAPTPADSDNAEPLSLEQEIAAAVTAAAAEAEPGLSLPPEAAPLPVDKPVGEAAAPPLAPVSVPEARPAPDPEPLPPIPAPGAEVVGAYESGGAKYTMYSDGSVVAEAGGETLVFRSLEELREFIDAGIKA